MFATALFVVVATAHMLATLKISARLDSVAVDDQTVRQIRLIETVAENSYVGIGYFLLCLLIIWFTAYRRYPLWAGWLTFIALVSPWMLYLKACGLVIHNVVTH